MMKVEFHKRYSEKLQKLADKLVEGPAMPAPSDVRLFYRLLDGFIDRVCEQIWTDSRKWAEENPERAAEDFEKIFFPEVDT